MTDLILIVRALLFYCLPLAWGLVLFWPFRTWLPRTRHTLGATVASVSTLLTGRPTDESALERTDRLFLTRILQGSLLFATGMSGILIWATLSDIAAQAFSVSFTALFFGGSYLVFALGSGIAFVQLAQHIVRSKVTVRRSLSLSVITVLIAGLIASWIWYRSATDPLNWDLFEHQTLATLIQAGEFSFFTNRMSDTFGFLSYPPSFHNLLALSQFGMELTPTAILRYWEMLSYFHTATVALVSFALGLAVTRKHQAAVVTGILSVFLFEAVMAFSSHFPLPQTLTAVLWTCLLTGFIWQLQHKQSSKVLYLIGFPTLFLSHFVIGAAGIALLLAARFVLHLPKLTQIKNMRSFWVLIGIGAVLGLLLSYVLNFGSINRGEAAAFSFSFGKKLEYLHWMYALTPVLALAGFWQLLRRQTAKTTVTIILVVSTLLGLVVLSGIPYAFKFLTLFHFVYAVLCASGLVWLTKPLPKVMAPAFALVLGILSLSAVTAKWQFSVNFDDSHSHVSASEVAAANFVQANFNPQTTLLISDPASQYIVEGLSGVNSPGGAVMRQEYRVLLTHLYTEYFGQVHLLGSVADAVTAPPTTKLLVLTGRSFDWFTRPPEQRLAIDFNIWRPHRFDSYDLSLIGFYQQQSSLKLIYQNDSVAIFQIL